MSDYELIKEFKEPSVIYQEFPEDPNNPEVLVKGVGRYRLKTLERNVREKLEDIGRRGVKANTFEDWKQVDYMINHSAMREMIVTIIRAKKELGGIKESWSPGRKNKIKELKARLNRLANITKKREEELEAAYEKIAKLERRLSGGRGPSRGSFGGSAGPFSKSDI